MYEFATGLINVLEKKIFDKEDQERMLKALDYKSAFDVLYDTDLSQFLEKEITIDEIISKDIKAQMNILKRISDTNLISNFLFLKYDLNFIKYQIKKYFFKDQIEEIDVLTFSPSENIKEWLNFKLDSKFNKERKIYFKVLPEISHYTLELIKRIIENLPQSPKSFDIEVISDKIFYEVKVEIAKRISETILNLVKFEIDFLNIRNLLRFKDEKEIVKNIFIPYGNLKKEEISRLLDLKEDIVFENIEKFLEIYKFSNIIHKFKKNKDYLSFDIEFLKYYSEYIFDISMKVAYGPEKIIEYFLKKTNGYNNIKLILFSKRYNIEISEIEDKLLPI